MLRWHPSLEPPPTPSDPAGCRATPTAWWQEWSSRSTSTGHVAEAVKRSLVTLKALTYAPTGGIVAAATTSLPEQFGGVRNWDYRYCWLRDATFTLSALMLAGYATRPRRGASGSCAPWPASRRSCRSCTACAASAGSTEYELP